VKKVLIADDSMFMRKLLGDILGKTCELVEADSGKTALAQFKSERPDLVLLDIVMPEGDEEGVRVLEQIRKEDAQASVIMITAVGQETVMDSCRRLGAKDYITKPFEQDQVSKTVEKYL
jgi:two-component system, chemotaxis family, chemotaxis protein CheY